MEIRKLEQQDIDNVISLVKQEFMKNVAREETAEGIENFSSVNTREFYNKDALMTYVAIKNQKIVGMISIRNHHINLLFVDSNYHRQGIARALVDRQIMEAKRDITVHSSLYGYDFYRAMGFHSTDIIQEEDGITFIPMVKRRNV